MTGIIVSTPPTVELPPGSTTGGSAVLPGVTYTYAVLNFPQTWTAKQTFPLGNISIQAGDIQGALFTLTTIGSSGAATYTGGVLNIPQYSGGTTPGGTSGQVQYNNSGAFGGCTVSGDATLNTGTGALSLATVNSNVGSFGSATAAATFTVDGKGRLTAAGSTTVTPAVGSVTGLGTGVATFLATPSSANLRAALTDEVGTGAAYFVGGALGTPASGTLTSCTAFTLTTTGTSGAATYSAGTLNVPQYSGGSGVASNINVKDPTYGATGNTKAVSVTVTINSGSPNLLATGATFVSGDVGKVIEVPGAGTAGAGLVTTILTFTDATHVVLAANAATTVTTTVKTIVYGTDDTAAIQAAITASAAAGGSNVFAPAGGYMVIGSGSTIFAWGATGGMLSGASEQGTIFYVPSSVGTSRDFLLFQGSATGIVLEDFSIYSIGTTSGRHLFQFDSTGGQFYRNVTIQRIFTFPAPVNGHVVYINNTGSAGGSVFQGIIRDNNLWATGTNACIKVVKGGDSIFIDHNLLSGTGYAIDFDQQSGAGQLIINSNNITASAMVKIAGAIAPIITYNEFEQLTTNTETNNAMLDMIGGLDSAKIVGNQIQALASMGNPTLIRLDTTTNTVIDDNRLSVPAVYAPIVITANSTNAYLGPGNYFPGSSSTITNSGVSTNDYYGSWIAYTPTVTAFTGTFTTVSATGRYKKIGKTIHVEAAVTVTTAGTAAGAIIVTLPFTNAAFNYCGTARENAVSGKGGTALIQPSSGNMSVFQSDALTFIATGAFVAVGATYEVP